MSKVIVNLTLPIVKEEVENVLDTYPCYPYQQAFAISDFKLSLIAYVLNRIPGIYNLVNEGEQTATEPGNFRLSTERLFHIETLIHRGILDILLSNPDWETKFLNQVANADCDPLTQAC